MIKTFFGFKTYPFSKEISSKDIFMSECFKELFSRLEYIRKNRGLMQVTGEPGTGKTLAMRTFIEGLNPNLRDPEPRVNLTLVSGNGEKNSNFTRRLCKQTREES